MGKKMREVFNTKKESIFLTVDQALEAMCIDFRQYDPQMLLFSEIIRLISDDTTVVKQAGQKNGVWISVIGNRNMRWLEGTDLVEYMCQALATADLNPDLLSSICARVFQNNAFPAVDPESGQKGIRIETGMEAFSCQQCGQCCMSLDFRNELTAEDVKRWEKLGRDDILECVGVYARNGQETTYCMWLTPGTGELAKQCPFLEKEASENRWSCRINDVKPLICRQYPATRKHAIMTGCPGFEY